MDQREQANYIYEEMLVNVMKDALVSESSVNIFSVLDGINIYTKSYGFIVKSLATNTNSLINMLKITRTLTVYDLVLVGKTVLVKLSFKINKMLADNEIDLKAKLIL